MRLGCTGKASEEAANYHTAPGALPRSLEHADFRTKKRLIAMLRSRDPCPEAMQNLTLLLQEGNIDAKVAAECLQKMSEWLRRNSQVTQQLCVKFRVHNAIVSVLMRHAGDIDVARSGLGVVSGAAVSSSENTTALTRGGVLLQVYKMMEAHPYDRIVLDNAAVALWRLGERGAARQITLTGGCAKMLRAMRDNPKNPFVQSNGCSALQVMLEHGGAQDIQAMKEAALVALSNHKANVPIRRGTDKLLRWCDIMLKKGARAPPKKVVRPAPKSRAGYESAALPQIRAPSISLKAWLGEVDTDGQLANYHRELYQNFDSVAHLLDAYARDGTLAPEFFDDIGIENTNHRELFQKWFIDLLNRQGDFANADESPCQLPGDLDGALRPPDPQQSEDLMDPGRLPRLATETFQRLESDDEEEDGDDRYNPKWPKGWVRALELLEKVELRESLWERAMEHLHRFNKRDRMGFGGFIGGKVRHGDDDNDDEDEQSSNEDGASSDDITKVDEGARACYNAALKTCEEGFKWEQALSLLSDMKRHVPPDENSYTAVIGACAAERQWQHALSLLNRLHDEGAYAKAVTYNAAIWSLEEEGAPWERATHIVEEMRKLGRQPSALTYTAVVNVFALHGRWEQTLSILEEMRENRMKPDVGTYRAIKEGEWPCEWPVERALDLLDAIQRAVKR